MTLRHQCQSSGKCKKGCRYGYPKALVEATEVSEQGKVALRRCDPNVNGHNWLALSLFRCDHDFKQLLFGTQTLSSIHYMTKYMTKTEIGTRKLYALTQAAARLQDLYSRHGTLPTHSGREEEREAH